MTDLDPKTKARIEVMQEGQTEVFRVRGVTRNVKIDQRYISMILHIEARHGYLIPKRLRSKSLEFADGAFFECHAVKHSDYTDWIWTLTPPKK